MRVGVLGLNHKSSDLHLRELFAKACRRRLSPDSQEAAQHACVLLSTCNRTEIYFGSSDLAETHSALLQLLREELCVPFEHKLYSYFGGDCFTHLALVTAGLDSVVLAETEIQRQVKLAYENTTLSYVLPGNMHFMFQKALKTGKWARTSFPLNHGHATLEGTILQLGDLFFQKDRGKRVLFIGNSEINRKILTFFKKKGVEKITLCTRSKISAKEFAKEQNIALVDWSELPFWWSYDLVVCGTTQQDFLLYPEQMPQRGEIATKLLFDLAVPRNVDPRLSRHPELSLFNIEKLSQLIRKKQEAYAEQLKRSEESIRESVHRQIEIFHSKTVHSCACSFV